MSGNSHQRAVRAKQFAQYAQALFKKAVGPPVNKVAEHTTPLKWLAKIGVASIAAGFLGMIFTFFWASVIVIYVGAILLLLDLWTENFEHSAWFRYVVSVLVLLGAYWFTVSVVLHKHPVFITYRTDAKGAVHVYVQNLESEDLSAVDLKVHLPPNLYVGQAWQISQLGSCSFFPPNGHVDDGDRVLSPGTGQTSTDGKNIDLDMFGSFQRVRCLEVPHEALLEIGLLVFDSGDMKKLAAPPSMRVTGTYKGQLKPFNINEDVQTFRAENGHRQ